MRLIRTLELVAAVTLAASGGLVAQHPTTAPSAAPAKTGKGEIIGVVVDSLNLRYLRGAEVIVQGADSTLVTDSTGQFRIGGLPPGTYQVGVFSPLIDSLGIAVASKPFHLGPDSMSSVILSVPSAATLVRRVCPSASADQGNSAVTGHVNDPETLKPVAGADVSIAWTDVEISKQFGFRRTPHVLRDTTNEAGAFHICGVPSPMDASLQARNGKAATAEIPISLGDADSQFLVRSLLLSRTDATVAAPSPSATAARNVPASWNAGEASVSGKVMMEGNSSGGASRVELVGTNAFALTNDKGEFTMNRLPLGSQVLVARHLGYMAQAVPVDLTPSHTQTVTITLPRFVEMMDPVIVTARVNASLDRVGFNQRQKSGSGYFFGPDRLQRMHPIEVTDILRHMPGVRVSGFGESLRVSSSRDGGSLSGSMGCVQYFLDDMPWKSATPGDISNFVSGNEIVAAEVYQPSQAPGKYASGLGSGCLTIVLWTRLQMPGVK